MTDIAALGFDIDSAPARTAAKDLDRLAASADKAERSAKKLSTSSRDLLRDESGRFMSAAQSAGKYADEIDALRAKYNPLYAASKQFETQQGELNRALALGAISLSQYDAAMATLQGGMVKSGAAAGTFGKQMNNASGHSTNVFSQLNDISVMMASGQNPLVLAMQQGTQLNQVWGQMGNNIGSVGASLRGAFMSMISPMSLLTIGVIAGGAALVQWGMDAWGAEEKARTLDDAMGDLDAGFRSYNGYIATASMTTAELTEKFGFFSEEIRGFSAYMAGLTLGDTVAAFNEQSTILKDGLVGIEQGLANVAMAQAQLNSISKDETPELWLAANDALDLFNANLDESATKLGILPSQAQGLADVLSGIRTDGSMSDLANQSAAALRYIERIAPNAMDIKGPLGEAYKAMYKVHENAKTAAKSTQELASSAPGAEWMNPAIGGVDALIGRVEAALGRVAALRSASMSALAAQYQQYGEGRVAGETAIREAGALYGGTGNVLSGTGWYDSSGGGSGGSGGGTDPYADNLTRLIESLMTERETVDAWYNENLTILNDRRSTEILGETAHKEALLDLEKEYLDRKSKLGEGYDQFTLGSAEKLFGELYSMSGSGYDGLLKLQKSFGAAQALVNTYTAASQVLADPKLGFFAKFAAVAKTVAAGMGLVNAIKGGGGSGGGGSGGASAPSVSTQAAEPDRVTRIELMGEDWQIALVEPIIEQIYKASGNGRVIIARG